ncbi:MAG TPA: fibrobacter succinogenes major paralogous domain-containing protein [Paludibacter sp.]
MTKINNLSFFLCVVIAFLLNSCNPTEKNESLPVLVTDVDGNNYTTVTIGTQTWMVENLKTTHYRNGDAIANVTGNTAWTGLSTGARCDYNNDATNSTKYGHLYNFFAVADSRNIAPVGWHVPTNAELKTLTDYVSAHLGTSLSVTKALAGTTDWIANSNPWSIGCNLTLNNSTGFSALPGGLRGGSDGKFMGVTSLGYWWSSTKDTVTTASYSAATARYIFMEPSYPDVFSIYSLDDMNGYGRQRGYSVRCVRD